MSVGPGLIYRGGGEDAFLARVNAAGTSLDYCGYVGGGDIDMGNGVAVDKTDSAYIAGTTGSPDFPVTVGPDLSYNGDGVDAFVAKVNSSGSGFVYAGYIGGDCADEAWAVAVDDNGQAYVAGDTCSQEHTFPVRVGPDLTQNGLYDAFVAKVNAAGSALVYAGYIGGSDNDNAFGIAVSADGSAYVAGSTPSTQDSFPVRAGPDLSQNGKTDAFVAKITADGRDLAYAGYIGGSNSDRAAGIAVNASGEAFVVGFTNSSEATFPVVAGPGLTYGGGVPDPMNGEMPADAFVAKVGDVTFMACKQNTEGAAIKDWLMTLTGAEPKSGRTLANGCITWAVTQPGVYTVTEEDRAGWTPQGATSADFTVVSGGGPYSHTFVNRSPTLWLPLIMR